MTEIINKITIEDKDYTIDNTKESITIPDCFVKGLNKIGRGHGEAKLYVGQVTDEFTLPFFDNFDKVINCVVKKNDLIKYLEDCESEYLHPEQNYVGKDKMPEIYKDNKKKVLTIKEENIFFAVYRSDVTPPRIYINSNAMIYSLIREISLPNISYLAILKLEDDLGNFLFYFRPFVDYHGEEIVKSELHDIENDKKLTSLERENIVRSRIGQGKYREKLLEDCPFCPITLVNDERLLVASHIKPWVKSENQEKIDPKNGFMFTPTYDKLFDRGFITFEDDGTMQVSPWISPINQKRLNIYSGKKVEKLPTTGREKYLKYHRENIFKK